MSSNNFSHHSMQIVALKCSRFGNANLIKRNGCMQLNILLGLNSRTQVMTLAAIVATIHTYPNLQNSIVLVNINT